MSTTPKMNFDSELGLYQMVNAIKVGSPEGRAFIEGGVLFNQKVLTACGAIHVKLMQLSDEDAEQFKADNSFFQEFAWLYYCDWRKQRAKSCAHLLSMYKLLNIKLGVQHFVGETFYAGIPLVTSAEIDEAIATNQVAPDGCTPIGPDDTGFHHEKIGIDGQLHKTDKYGEFEPWSDPNDIYGDGSGVTLAELKAATAEDASPCLSCKWGSLGCNSQCDEGCDAYEKI
jgi:hypothetical protein